jgi:hypothetical protein
MMYAYQVYGLSCVSDVAIPGLPPLAGKTGNHDVVFSFNPAPPVWVKKARRLRASLYYTRPELVENPPYSIRSLGGGTYFELSYSDGTQFLLGGAGECVWGTYPPHLTINDFAVYLRGPIMGFLLQRRKTRTLHASALSIGGHAVVLCGPKESGKSTAAAAFSLRGISILTEDIAVLRKRDGVTQVAPGYPWICLWPEATEAVIGRSDALPRLTPTWEKCFLQLENKFQRTSQPLGAVYLLSARTPSLNAPRIEKMTAQQAIVELLQNTYMNWLLDREQRAAEFDFLANLVTEVPVRRIVPHTDPARIGELCDLVLADVENLNSLSSCQAAQSR